MRILGRLVLAGVVLAAMTACSGEDPAPSTPTGGDTAPAAAAGDGDKAAFCEKFKENARWSQQNFWQPTEQAWGAEMAKRTEALPPAPASLKKDVAAMIQGYKYVGEGGKQSNWGKQFPDNPPTAAIFSVSGACLT
jgi:hypothetical protein